MHPIPTQSVNPHIPGHRNLTAEQQPSVADKGSINHGKATPANFQHFFEAETDNPLNTETDIVEDSEKDAVIERQGDTNDHFDNNPEPINNHANEPTPAQKDWSELMAVQSNIQTSKMDKNAAATLPNQLKILDTAQAKSIGTLATDALDQRAVQSQLNSTIPAHSNQIKGHTTHTSSFAIRSIVDVPQNTVDQAVSYTKDNPRFPEQASVPIAKPPTAISVQNLFSLSSTSTHLQEQSSISKASASDALLTPLTDVSLASTLQQTITPMRSELPIHIARQLAEVVQHMPSRPVEITLNPDELGRVRLSVAASEGGIIVNVLAERPETLDLLRRHIDQLSQQFQALGYQDIAFSFAGAEGDPANHEGDTESEDHKDMAMAKADSADAPVTHIHLSAGATAGLDLRL